MNVIAGTAEVAKGDKEMTGLWKRINEFLRTGLLGKNRKDFLLIIIAIMMFLLVGCTDKTSVGSDGGAVSVNMEVDFSDKRDFDDIENIEIVYRDVCDRAMEENTSGNLEMVRSIVKQLGEKGYTAVDHENQIDMVCPEQIKQFCRKVEAQEESEAALIVVISANRFEKYEFTTKDGTVGVEHSYFLYKGGCWETVSSEKYQAYTWVYSQEGYLFFEKYYMPGFDGPSGHTAVRIEPLDEVCRELNRNYLRTIGYELNNLFTSDWNEDDFGALNFYDLYAVLRRMKKGQYGSTDFFEEGVTYEIPKSEFEGVFQTFFQIDSQELRQYTIYHADTETYQYRERGMFDFAPTPNIPYPEVVAYEENQDGTIKLIVNAVWTEKNLEKAFCHEVIVRPLEDGSFQYVSNHIIPSEDNVEITWYTERLSDKQWQEYYGGKDSEKEYNLPVSDDEKEEAPYLAEH